MCGIIGILNLTNSSPIPKDTLLGMLSTIQHRGPDGFGIYRDNDVGLGNARLSIIDLSGGDQPIGNEDGSNWIVFNGEIFNYVELRPGLEKKGHHFSTNCDTEVILHLYEDYGPDCLRFLNGQFAVAIWDANNHSLFLARDRVGIRPLFYTQHDGQFIFGSEIKALLAVPGMKAEIDLSSLREIFTYWSPLTPHTVFKNIYELPPAQYMVIRGEKIVSKSYWGMCIQPQESERNEIDYLEEFESLLIDSTRIRLRADVPVGAYLSGGLDSSTTTAMVRTHTSNRLDTFSITFSDPAFDESIYQKQMSMDLGTNHHEVHCDYRDIAVSFPEVIWHTEVPILRTAPAPMFLLSKLVREHNFKVVLTGEGADEFLAGYDIFKEMKIRRFWAENPESSQRSKLLFRLYPDINRLSSSGAFLTGFFKKDLLDTESPFYSHKIRWNNTSRTRRFLMNDNGPEVGVDPISLSLPADFKDWSHLGQSQYLEIITFLSPYLLSSQGDRMAMANSVEGRYPFLDYRVIEFCNRLPSSLKMPVLTEKWLLKRLAQKYVPEKIWQRKKRPYRAPVHRSFFDPVPLDYVTYLLSENSLRKTGYFDPSAVSKLVQKTVSGANLSEIEDMALVGILSTQLIDEYFIQSRNQTKQISPPERIKLVDRVSAS